MALSFVETAQANIQNAQIQYRDGNVAETILAYKRAAAAYDAAAAASSDPEAKNALLMLEQHHTRLARICQSQSSTPATRPSPQSPEVIAAAEPVANRHSPKANNLLAKEHGSSLASDLASARGIHSTPTTSAHQSRAPSVNPRTLPITSNLHSREQHVERGREYASKLGDAARGPTQNEGAGDDVAGTPSEQPPSVIQDAYARFQASFGYLFSGLSSPLAFAGLPLDPSSEVSPSYANPTTRDRALPRVQDQGQLLSSESDMRTGDLSALFSAAAIKAAHSSGAGPDHLNESFHVVQPDGLSSGGAPDLMTKPKLGQQISRALKPDESQKSMEELRLENVTLRNQVDYFSTRLQAFQSVSQSASMALHQSLRSMRSASPGKTRPARSGQTVPTRTHRAEDTELLAQLKHENEELAHQNAKLKKSMARYKEKQRQLQKGNAKLDDAR